MSELIVEYLYFTKRDLPEEISKVFKKSISSYVKDSQLKCEFQGEKLVFDFNIVPYNNSLHVIFKYKKSGNIGIKEVHAFQETLKNLNVEISKSKLKCTTLLDTSSLFLSKKILPYLHNYEWSMRKLIYLVAPTYFTENWIEDSIPKEIIKRIKEKLRGKWKPDNLLQWLDLSDFEEYLFGENYVQINGENEVSVLKIKEVSTKKILSLIHEEKISLSKPYSLWEEIFNEYVNIELDEIQTDMRLIREGRNNVGHNKELTVPLYQELLKKLKMYINHLDNAFQRILVGDIEDEVVDIMADDFNGYLGYQWDTSAMRATLSNVGNTMSALQGLDTSAMRASLSNVGNTMSVLQGLDTSAMRASLSNVGNTMSALQGLDTSAMRASLSNVGNTMSALQGLDTSAMRASLSNVGNTMSALQGLDTSAMRASLSNVGNTMSALQGLDTSAMRASLSNVGNTMSALQGLDTSAMRATLNNVGNTMSALQGLDTSAMRATLSNVGNTMSALQGLDTSAMRATLSNVGNTMSALQGLDTSAMKESLSNLDNAIPSQEETSDNLDDESTQNTD